MSNIVKIATPAGNELLSTYAAPIKAGDVLEDLEHYGKGRLVKDGVGQARDAVLSAGDYEFKPLGKFWILSALLTGIR